MSKSSKKSATRIPEKKTEAQTKESIYWVYFFIFLGISMVLVFLLR